MKVKHKDVRVRISKRILWVGPQAYPLSQVVRVHPVELRLKRIAVLREFGRRAGATIGIAVLGLLAMAVAGRAVPLLFWVVFWLIVGGILLFHTVHLARLLRLPKLYVLRVAMAGSGRDQAAVMSTDESQIDDLTTQVADAIDNPAAEYEIRVDNIEFVYGDKIDGDKVDGDKVLGNESIFEGFN
jgi:hypothetical protein